MKIEIPKEPIQLRNLVGGEWIPGQGAPFKIRSPYSNEIIGEAHEPTADEVQRALIAAQKAFTQWSRTPIKERTQCLFRLRENLLKRQDNISHLVAAESGKTFSEAKAGLLKGIEVLEYALSLQNLDRGGRLEVSRGVFCETRREPLGVVLGITPFNFPAMVPLWMIPIALVVGNSFVWKPSDKTPLTSSLIGEAVRESGFPPGVFTILQGGRPVVESLIDHPLIQAVGFVGSSPVAKSVYLRATQKLKRALALGGAKNHVILLPDAHPELTASGIMQSFCGCAGQRCMAASVLLAVGDVDHFIKDICEQARQLGLGSQMGAIISKDSLVKLHGAISEAEAQGAKVLVDGRTISPPREYAKGHWLGATVLDHVQPQSRAAQEELFGPVLSIIRVKTLEEALEIENANPFGNAASIFTQNGGSAERLCERARAGMLGINIGVPVPREPFSFGGFYESRFGYGDITGEGGLNFWSDTKKITAKWALQKDQSWLS